MYRDTYSGNTCITPHRQTYRQQQLLTALISWMHKQYLADQPAVTSWKPEPLSPYKAVYTASGSVTVMIL